MVIGLGKFIKFSSNDVTLHKKSSFPLKLSSVNVTKPASLNGRLHFLCSVEPRRDWKEFSVLFCFVFCFRLAGYVRYMI